MKTKKTSKLKVFLLRTLLICFALNLTGFVSAAHACEVEYFRKSSHHKYLKAWPYNNGSGDADYIGKMANGNFSDIQVVDGKKKEATDNAKCVIKKLEKHNKDYKLSCDKIDAQCLEKFQKHCKIGVDGLVGPETARTLNKGCGDPIEDKKEEEEVVEEEKKEEGQDENKTEKSDSNSSYNPIPDAYVGNKLPGKAVRLDSGGNFDEDYFNFKFFAKVTKVALSFAGILALIFLMIGGLQMIIAGGVSSEGFTSGRKTAVWAVIGLFITITSYAVVAILNTIFTSRPT